MREKWEWEREPAHVNTITQLVSSGLVCKSGSGWPMLKEQEQLLGVGGGVCQSGGRVQKERRVLWRRAGLAHQSKGQMPTA